MKHLKTYTLFERISKFQYLKEDEIQEHVRVLTDMTLSLRDKDFSVFNVYAE